MEYYTLDDQCRRDQLIEGYSSIIWTEREQDVGDFQIVIPSTPSTRALFTTDLWIWRKGSTYVMIIDTITDAIDPNDGSRNLTITGKSLENILNDRVAYSAIIDTTSTPNWTLTDTPGNIIRTIFQLICVAGILSPNDTIPFYTPGTLLPPGGIEEETEIITVVITPDTLFNIFQQLCQTYFLGFRFVRNGDLGEIYFEVYTGSDRTSAQSILPAVIFDPDMDNLGGVSWLTSSAAVKTVAYVFAANGAEVVYGPYSNPDDSGTDRRVLVVNSSNSDPAGDDLTDELHTEGLIALSSQRLVYSFDGEIPQNTGYVYGVDYNLGDIIEERQAAGFGNFMYVTEQIFTSDDTGDHSYPTLVVQTVVTPGSWASWDHQIEWDQEDDSITWASLS